MEIFVSAGDASSEMHAAQAVSELQKLLKEKNPESSLKVFGLVGDKLQDLGAKPLMHTKEFSVGGGPLEVIGKLPKRMKLENLLEDYLSQNKVSGALLVDNGEINLRLASLLNFFNVPVIYYIPPKVWVWRQSRLIPMAYHVKKVLGILPFERKLYEEWEIPFQYVGNPLLDEVDYKMTEKEARDALNIDGSHPIVSVLLGSRHSEVRFHTDLFLKAIIQFHESLKTSAPENLKNPTYVFPVPKTIDVTELTKKITDVLAPLHIDFRIYKEKSHECMRVSRAALIKSGTSTLEGALIGCPMVVAYQSGLFAAFMFHNILRYKDHVSLANLILAHKEKPAVEEFILEKCTVKNLSEGLLKIYLDGSFRTEQINRLRTTEERLQCPTALGKSPSTAVAKEMLETFKKSEDVNRA